MSDELGTICFGEDEQQVFLGRDLGHSRNYSEAIAFSIDKEVKRIMDECHTRAHDILNEHRDKLDAVAKALQEREVINAFEFQGVMDGKDLETIEREEAEYLAKLNEEKKKKIEEAKKNAPKTEPAKVDVPSFMQQKPEQSKGDVIAPVDAPKAPETEEDDDDEEVSHWEGYPGLKGKMTDEELGLPSYWRDEDDKNK